MNKIIFGNSPNMYIFLAKMNKIWLKIVNSGDFAMILLLKVRKNLILTISFMQHGT